MDIESVLAGQQFRLGDPRHDELKALALPLMKWLSENCHPHVKAIVDSENMELMEGMTAVQRVATSTI